MSTTIKPVYAATAAMTWTSAGTLGSAAAAGCLAIDNTTNLYLDAMVKILVGVGVVAAPKFINIWGSLSEDGTDWLSNSATTDAYTGADAAITLGAPTIFLGPQTFPTQQASVSAKLVIPSVCKLLGCLVLPRKWGLIVENQTAVAFTSFSAEYTGINPQNV